VESERVIQQLLASSDQLGERLVICSEERAIEAVHKLAQMLPVHGSILYAVAR
jgi:hypothetical protein